MTAAGTGPHTPTDALPGPSAPPAAVLVAALAARDAWAYARVAALCDPDALAALHAGFIDARRPKTLADFRRYFPELDDEAAARRFPAWHASVQGFEGGFEQTVPGVRTLDELSALSPAEFFARAARAADERAELVQRIRARGEAVPAQLLGTRPGLRHDVLGVVAEVPDLAHALYREVLERPGEPPLEGEVALATLRRQPDGAWRLVVRDWHGLQGGGSSFAVLPDEFPDLWGDEPPGDGGPHGGAPPSAVEPAA